jgi:hypothetical protein
MNRHFIDYSALPSAPLGSHDSTNALLPDQLAAFVARCQEFYRS